MLRFVNFELILCYFQLLIGRILNRFSKDQGTCDELLPMTMFDFIQVHINYSFSSDIGVGVHLINSLLEFNFTVIFSVP